LHRRALVQNIELSYRRPTEQNRVVWVGRRATTAGARVLAIVDSSGAGRTAVRWAERLAGQGAAIEVVYFWTASGDVASADRVASELTRLSGEDGAIDLLDRIGALHRRGVLNVRGCVTVEGVGGAPLTALARRAGYDAVLLGLRWAPDESHRFRLHTFPMAVTAR
jgi:hypothetical protein